jgi:serine/threonine protein kinase/Tol biopolymer transport system component
MIGQIISHYKILEKLGEGGMGVVYRAQDTKLDRLVALKFLPSHLSASEQDKARFIQEAKAASAINHPNICTVYSIDEHDGQLFIVMEFVDGQTLRERTKSQSTNLKNAIDIGIQIADGLAAAHEKGIVHRDIKPENIMVRKDGIVQIMDFGLAKLRGVSRLTKEGSTVGTAGYMSPEQVQGQDADHRSDIFSFGVLLYELFIGQLPFRGVHETALLYEIVNVDPAPMSTVRSDIDPELDRIVLECLQKEPSERHQSVAEVSKDLKRFKRESSRQHLSRVTTVRPVAHQAYNPAGLNTWARGKPWMIATVLLTVVLVIVVWRSHQMTIAPSEIARFAHVLPQGQELDVSVRPALAISPDGSRLVYVANNKLYMRRRDELGVLPIERTEGASNPFFSPDGQWIAYVANGKLSKVSVNGGTPVDLTSVRDFRGGAWGRAGRIVFSPDVATPIMEISEAGEDFRALTTLDSSKHERTHRWPSISPDGKTILFTVGVAGNPDFYEDAIIDAVDISTGKRSTVLRGASTAMWAATDHLLYTRSGVLFATQLDRDRLLPIGSPTPVVQGINGDASTGAMHLSLSANGTLIYIPGQHVGAPHLLALIDQQGNVTNLPAPAQSYGDLKLSPDGTRVAAVLQKGEDYDIWIYDIPRNTMGRLTFGGNNRSPVWSSDGNRILHWSENNGVRALLLRSADGSGLPDTILTTSFRDYPKAWSRDGKTIVLARGALANASIMTLSLDGDRVPRTFLANNFDTNPSDLSPDGRWIAYTSNESGSYQVFVESFPNRSGRWQVSPDGGGEPRWSPDGTKLYYRSAGRMMVVPVAVHPSFSAGQPRVLFDRFRPLQVGSGITYDVSRDGTKFLTTRPPSDERYQHIVIVLNWFEELKNIVSISK